MSRRKTGSGYVRCARLKVKKAVKRALWKKKTASFCKKVGSILLLVKFSLSSRLVSLYLSLNSSIIVMIVEHTSSNFLDNILMVAEKVFPYSNLLLLLTIHSDRQRLYRNQA